MAVMDRTDRKREDREENAGQRGTGSGETEGRLTVGSWLGLHRFSLSLSVSASVSLSFPACTYRDK